jgi:hypothetical protein
MVKERCSCQRYRTRSVSDRPKRRPPGQHCPRQGIAHAHTDGPLRPDGGIDRCSHLSRLRRSLIRHRTSSSCRWRFLGEWCEPVVHESPRSMPLGVCSRDDRFNNPNGDYPQAAKGQPPFPMGLWLSVAGRSTRASPWPLCSQPNRAKPRTCASSDDDLKAERLYRADESIETSKQSRRAALDPRPKTLDHRKIDRLESLRQT